MNKICFIGLGNMGLPMANNLLKAGYSVKGIDLSDEAKNNFESLGGIKCDDIGEGVHDADFVVTMLPSGKHVKNIYCDSTQGVINHAKKGCLFIDCSTIDVETSRDVSKFAEANNFLMLDAPVSGGVGGAEAATLTFMVGGDKKIFEHGKSILEKMGKNIIHAGDAGAGQAAKICNNMLLGISMIATCEAFVLAEKLGLDAQRLFDIASTSSGQCWSLTTYCPVPGPVPTSPSNRDYQPGFATAMMLKDMRLSQEASENVSASTPLGQHAEKLYAQFLDQGNSDVDFSGIINMLRKSNLSA